MNRSQLRGGLPEPVNRYFDEIALMQPPDGLLDAAIEEIERTTQLNRFAPLPFVGLAAAVAIGIALLFSGFFPSSPLKFGSDETPIPTATQAPTPEPLAVVGRDGNLVQVAAFRLAEGEGPRGPWSYWVWTAHCAPSGLTVVYQWIEYAPLRGGVAIDLEQCHGGDSREQPYVVERSGVGDDGWAFLYGQTRLDVVRVKVRLVDGREYETETLAAPGGLDWNARFYVMLLPVNHGEIDTVRGYDASGQDVGGDSDPGPGAP